MDKINLLLIDDNPKFCWLKIKNAIALGCIHDAGYSSEQLEKSIPVIINDAPENEGEQWGDIEKYFKLKWLQSPLDVREFFDLSSEIESRFTAPKLGEIGFIPEIVCSDYALTDRMDTSYYDYEQDTVIFSALNPNYQLAEYFNNELKEKKELYRHSKEVILNYKTDAQPNNDNMGCYAGGITAFVFRNHPCSLVPVTFKTKDKVEGKEAGYFEWLLHNEFDEVFDWEDRGEEKSWYKIIKVATNNLRKRIMRHTQSGKILPVYNELLKLSVGEFENETGERVFTFYSIYGKRELPLDALFIEFDSERRSDEVIKWAQELLKKLYEQKWYSLSTEVLSNAFRFSDELWKRYKNETDSVLKRLKISELGYLLALPTEKLAKEIGVTETEDNYFEIVKNEFNEEYEILTKEFGLRKKGKTDSLEYGYDLRSGNFTCIERRWGVFITMLRLHHHFLEYERDPDKKLSKYANLRAEPQEDDYYLALFPLATSPIVTRIHDKDDGDNFKKALKRRTSLIGDTKDGGKGLEMDSILNCIMDENGILPSEKYLLKSIIKNEKEFPFYAEPLNIPTWLKGK